MHEPVIAIKEREIEKSLVEQKEIMGTCLPPRVTYT
jgi:hypothetical protein